MEDLYSYIYLATAIIGGVWIALWLFVILRRRASNLTPVSTTKGSKKAAPDFMKVDHAKREAAIKAGDAYNEKLVEREAAEAAAAAGEPVAKELTMAEKFGRFASTLFAVFSLLVTVVQAINNAQSIEGLGAKVSEIVSEHPIAFAIAAFVILFHITTFFTRKRWKEARH